MLFRDFWVGRGWGGEGDDFAAAIPPTREGVEEALARIDELFGPQEGNLISADHQAALISVMSGGAETNEEVLDRHRILTEAAEANFGPVGVDHKIGGITPLTVDMLGNLVPSQIYTAITALLLSALVLVLVFRSFAYGLATLSVLMVGVASEMALLAIAGWKLDMMTVLIAAIIIGVGIDFGIHVTHRFREEFRPGEVGVGEALELSIQAVGKPMVASVVSMAGAFAIIMLSKMIPIQRFGAIISLSLVVSLAASLLVLPSLIVLIARRHISLLKKERELPAEAVDLHPAEVDT